VAVGNAVLDVLLADGFLEQVQSVAGRLRAKLEEFARRHPDLIEEVRGEGLMIGLKCRVPNTDVIARLRANRMLTAGAGDNVVRLLPPLIIDDSHIEEGLGVLEHTAASWQLA
jgi:acetylornithine/N-succinyldiaminopimelate aminotransferase